MFNFLRMDFYRMVHIKTTWVFLAIIAVSVVITTSMVGYMSTDAFKESYAQSMSAMQSGVNVGVSTPDAGAGAAAPSSADINPLASLAGGTFMTYVGGMFVSGGSLALLVMLYLALFLASEFDSGFAKNIFTARTNRLAYAASKAVLMLVVAVLFSAFTFALAYIGSLIVGLDFQAASALDFIAWYLLVVLVLFAFAMITGFVAWAIRNKVIGILVAVFVGGGIVYQLVNIVCQLSPALKDVPNFMLSGCLMSLATATDVFGPLGAPHIIGVAVAFLVVFALAGTFALKKRDI